jgi:signal transduction histidine kinase
MAFAAVFAAGMLLISGFIYWETVGYLTRRVDAELRENVRLLATKPEDARLIHVQHYLETDPDVPKLVGLFDAAGRPLAGDLDLPPAGLPTAGKVGEVKIPDPRAGRTGSLGLRVLTQALPGGETIIIGRSVRATHEIDEIVTRALLLALVPMVVLALVGGVVVSRGALRRIAAVHSTSRLIMAGQLDRRLPVSGAADDFDKLANIVNDMLDEIERLMLDAKSTGEDIAHDLRTPLTRLRGRFERAASAAAVPPETAALAGAAIEDIDQILGTVTAILRIAEVEHGQRRAGFRQLDLVDVVREAVELYEPISEEKGVSFAVDLAAAASVRGDGDLLFEALANLLDNAIKFTPSGGHVAVSLRQESRGPVIRVADDGPGISPADRPKILRRFYRGDRSRHTPGTGLGLNLVAAIVRLHGFGLVLDEATKGCTIAIQCWAAPDDQNQEAELPRLDTVALSPG